LEAQFTPQTNKIPALIGISAWILSVALAIIVIVVHWVGRQFITLPREFKVSEKRIAKDLEKIRKREEE
jgi:hypothetical protein